MRFLRVTDPRLGYIFVPWFVECDLSRKDMFLILMQKLTHEPDEIFAALVIDNDLIKGAVIACTRKEDVLLWQARGDNGIDTKTVDRVLDGIGHWAKSKGYSRITAFPNRARKLWVRRWGFRPSPENEHEVYKETG